MLPTCMTADRSRTIRHAVRTAVVDIVTSTRGGREFNQREYERVDFLENGWGRCVRSGKREDGNRSVDYYPPQTVSETSGVELPAEA